MKATDAVARLVPGGDGSANKPPGSDREGERTGAETDSPEQRIDSDDDGSPILDGDDSPPDPQLEGIDTGHRERSRELPYDDMFEILKNRRRRLTLLYLVERDGQVTLSDLAEHVAVVENDIDEVELTSDQRKRAYVGLYQCHLPKMDELGAVDFDGDRGTIELGPNADQLLPYLGGPREERTWPAYYLAMAGSYAVVLGGLLASGVQVGLVVGLFVVLLLLSFGGLALVHADRVGTGDLTAER